MTTLDDYDIDRLMRALPWRRALFVGLNSAAYDHEIRQLCSPYTRAAIRGDIEEVERGATFATTHAGFHINRRYVVIFRPTKAETRKQYRVGQPAAMGGLDRLWVRDWDSVKRHSLAIARRWRRCEAKVLFAERTDSARIMAEHWA